MGIWSHYLLVKLLMFITGFIGLHVWENLLFALFVALPARARALRVLKHLIALPAAIALLYYDSYLPPARRLLVQADQLGAFSWEYLLELAPRFINLPLVAAIVLTLVLLHLLSRKLRLGSFAVLGVLLSPWMVPAVSTPTQPESAAGAVAAVEVDTRPQALDARLHEFHIRESTRRVSFKPVATEDVPFDILLLQICSLAWDDLDFSGLRQHPLLQNFDLRFEQFGAAASYSGPAAIRLLRAPCGQQPHEGLYQPVEPGCQLMNGLAAAGFEPQWAMNHDGVFGNMLADIRERGGLKAALFPLAGTPVAYRSFEGSDYHDDYAVLSAWWQQRLQSAAPRVALYYNSGSLHDGNRFTDGRSASGREGYRQRTEQLFDGVARFIKDVEASGRRAVVVFVPEHGANLRGERLQIAGLREIPSPAVGLVPVGIKLVGVAAAEPVVVERPSSYLALAQLLAAYTARSPYAADAPPLAELASRLAATDYVAENDGSIIMRVGGRDWLRGPDKRWSEYRGR